jgi:hypothetical protein
MKQLTQAQKTIAALRAALQPGAVTLQAQVAEWLRVPAVVMAIKDTRDLTVTTAAQQIQLMTGHQLPCPLVDALRASISVAPVTTVSVAKLTLSEHDDTRVKEIWTQAHERAVRMHSAWRYVAESVEQRMENGLHPSEKHMRLLAVLNDSAGGAARAAAALFEVAASRTEMSTSGQVSGRPPISLDANGCVIIDVDALPQEEAHQKGVLEKWQPVLPPDVE